MRSIRRWPLVLLWDEKMEHWRQQLGLSHELVGIGIDRVDYTKGIPERLRALERLLENYPQYREKLLFVQIGVPSRMHTSQYQTLDIELDQLVEEINWRWGTDNWQPIHYLKRQFSQLEMMALHRLAHFCVVSSLDDGMNLVAKEFVASRFDGDGVLILSQFTGAARELTSAVLVNPFDMDQLSAAVFQALNMSEEERIKPMERMRLDGGRQQYLSLGRQAALRSAQV